MMDNAGGEGPQLSILRATVAFNAMPAKERIICVDIYRLGKLISWSTLGEVFIDPAQEEGKGIQRAGGQPTISLSTFCIWEFSKKAPAGRWM